MIDSGLLFGDYTVDDIINNRPPVVNTDLLS